MNVAQKQTIHTRRSHLPTRRIGSLAGVLQLGVGCVGALDWLSLMIQMWMMPATAGRAPPSATDSIAPEPPWATNDPDSAFVAFQSVDAVLRQTGSIVSLRRSGASRGAPVWVVPRGPSADLQVGPESA